MIQGVIKLSIILSDHSEHLLHYKGANICIGAAFVFAPYLFRVEIVCGVVQFNLCMLFRDPVLSHWPVVWQAALVDVSFCYGKILHLLLKKPKCRFLQVELKWSWRSLNRLWVGRMETVFLKQGCHISWGLCEILDLITKIKLSFLKATGIRKACSMVLLTFPNARSLSSFHYYWPLK